MEFSYMLMHLAHLKSPEMIGGNSALQLDLTEIKEGIEKMNIEAVTSDLGESND